MAQEDRVAAAALQRSLLPSALPATDGAQMAVRYVPGEGTVGGDWYDVFALPSGQLCVVIGDVTGSGLALLCKAVTAEPPDAACAAVMAAMVGNEPARDDIALLVVRRSPSGTQ